MQEARIHAKYIQETKDNGGYSLPNFHLYYQTAALTWIKNCILCQDKDILLLESHDLPQSYHSYLWMEE